MASLRLVVIGNGPSLKGFDFQRLTGIDTLGMNAAYRYWDKVNWYPTHYSCLDDELLITHHAQIKGLVDTGRVQSAFLTGKFLEFYPDAAQDPRYKFLDQFVKYWHEARGRKFGLEFVDHPAFHSVDETKLTTGSYSTRYGTYCGYRSIGLLGIDLKYVEIIPEARRKEGIGLQIAETPKHNPNYFFDDYQRAGDRYNIPNPDAHQGNLHLASFDVLARDLKSNMPTVGLVNLNPQSALVQSDFISTTTLELFLNPHHLSAVIVPSLYQEREQLLANMWLWDQSAFVPFDEPPATAKPKLVFSFNNDTARPLVDELRSKFYESTRLKDCFAGIDFLFLDLWGEDDLYERSSYKKGVGEKGYRAGPNNAFFSTMGRLVDLPGHILLMESDCIPIRSNWLGRASDLVKGPEPFWIKGSIYRGKGKLGLSYKRHLNGNALYRIGDEEFRSFIFDFWRPRLDDMVRERDRRMAYDCALEIIFEAARCDPDDSDWRMLQRVAHLFQFSDFIQNISATQDNLEPEIDWVQRIRRESPTTYMLHGQLFARAVRRLLEQAAEPHPDNLVLEPAAVETATLGPEQAQIGEGMDFDSVFMSAAVHRAGASYVIPAGSADNYIMYRYVGAISGGDWITATTNFAVDRPCKLHILLGREGENEWEAEHLVRDFTVGQHSVVLERQFKKSHPGARIQIGSETGPVVLTVLRHELKRRDGPAALTSAVEKSSGDDALNVSLASIPFPRGLKVQLDECRLVFEAMWNGTGGGGVMLDVGAHHGSSLSRFAAAGWIIYAFEPDPANRETLVKSHGAKSNVVICGEAICDVSGAIVPFYASHESTGISSLGAFRNSHREVAKVRTVTLNDVVARHDLAKIDFLKIDVEGFEMAVLRGLDFNRLKPSAIVAEFEDSKTSGMGYRSHDLARMLLDQGYSVYVSEWHPVERYGVKHSWRSIQKYPCEIPGDSWGNLVAFLEDPPVNDLKKAVRAAADTPVQFVGDAVAMPNADVPTVSEAASGAEASALPSRVRQTFAGAAPPSRSVHKTPDGSRKLHGIGRSLRNPVVMSAVAVVALLGAGFVTVRAVPSLWLGSLTPSVWFSVIAVNLLVSVILGGAAYAHLKKRTTRQRRSSRRRIDKLKEQLGRRNEAQERLEKGLRAVDGRLVGQAAMQEKLLVRIGTFDERLAGQTAAQEKLAERIGTLDGRVAGQVKAQEQQAKQIGTLEGRVAGQVEVQERTAQHISALESRVARQVKAQEKQAKHIGTLEGRVAGQVEAQEQTAQHISALEGRVAGQSLAFSHLNAANASRARPHARLLEDAALLRLERHWAPLLGLQYRPSALFYLAHQLCLAEDRCEGRLATTIETALLRLLALRSLKGPEVDLIEIGSLFGLGAGLLHRFRGEGIARLRLTLIDPLTGYYGVGEADPITGITVGVDTLLRNMHSLGVPAEDIVLLKGLSMDAEIIETAQRRSYDFVLIDGDHSGEGVRRDFETYGPMIRPGGLVLFDDYDTSDWTEIKPAVDEFMASAKGWEWLGADYRTGIARRVQTESR